ncbi:hypothetical protein V8C35DRAFT_324590 [Trichoderma chlorosporum]
MSSTAVNTRQSLQDSKCCYHRPESKRENLKASLSPAFDRGDMPLCEIHSEWRATEDSGWLSHFRSSFIADLIACAGYERAYKFKLITGCTSSSSKSQHAAKHQRSSRLITRPSASYDGLQLGTGCLPQLGGCIRQTAVACDAFVGPFLKLLFPPDADPCSWRIFPGGWICSLPTLFHNRGELVNQALLALYTGFIGKKHGDARLTNFCGELYVNALRNLRNSDIWLKQSPCSDDIDATLAIIIVFSRIEVLTSECGLGGYKSHVRGGLQLVKRFSGRLSDSILTSTMIRTLRFLGFFDAIRHQQPYFMSQAPYDTLYLAQQSDPDYLMQIIIEAAVALPNLEYDTNKLCTLQHTGEDQIRQAWLVAQYLLDEATIVNGKLDHCLQQMASVTPHPTLIVTPTAESGECYLPGRQMEFVDCSSKCLWLLYWSVVVRLGRLIKKLHNVSLMLSSKLPEQPRLPAAMLGLVKDDYVLDQYADSIGISLGAGMTASTFHAQEALIFVLNLYWYWEVRGDTHKANWCIQTLKALQNQGLGMEVEVNQRPAQRESQCIKDHEN